MTEGALFVFSKYHLLNVLLGTEYILASNNFENIVKQLIGICDYKLEQNIK